MALLPWQQHFFASTRGQIILLLRRADSTVDELAQALHLTDNAVRAHLATLERDGLICQAGTRRGSGKPALLYSLAAGAEQLFSRAYGPALRYLLEALSASLSSEQLAEIMQSAGRRMAIQWDIPAGDLRTRLQFAVIILNELGGLAELEALPERPGSYAIQSSDCPLAAVVPNHPEVCQLTRAFLAELIGAPVVEHCARNGAAKCAFTIKSAHSVPGSSSRHEC